MGNMYLFTGENHYVLFQEKKRWIAGFIEKYGEENLQQLDARSIEFRSLMDELGSSPFLAEKRLLVLEGMPKLEKEQAEILVKEIHPQVLFLVVDPKPDKRLGSTKIFLKSMEVKTFEPLTREGLLSWMQQYATEHGVQFAAGVAQYLLERVGDDQQLLAQEIIKLALYAQTTIERTHVDAMVSSSTEQAGWQIMDLLASQNTNGALRFARKLLDRGESPQALWSMLLWITSSFVSVYGAVEQGQTNPGAIASATGVNFVTVRNLIPLARKISREHLQSIVGQFARAERDVKTGGIRATAEAPQEMLALIDQSLLSFQAKG